MKDRQFLYHAVCAGGKYPVCAGQNCHYRYDHGGAFPDHKAHHGEADRGRKPVLLADIIDQVDAAHPTDLFRELGKGRNAGFADAVEVAVDTGMNGSHGNGEGDDAKQWGRPLLHQKDAGDVVRTQIDIEGAGDGERHCQKKTCPERAKGTLIITGGGLAGYVFGDGGLDARDREGEGEGQHGRDELIDAHALRAEYIGEKNAVEKADKAADQSGYSQNHGSGHQGVRPFFQRHRAPSL